MLLFFLTYNVFCNQIIAQPLKIPLNCFFLPVLVCCCWIVPKRFNQNVQWKRDWRVFFLYVFVGVWYISNVSFRTLRGLQVNTQEVGEKKSLQTHKSEFYTVRHSKVCTHAEEISWNTFSMTRICRFLNTCMCKQPQSMPNVSKPWWRVEISWLSHVVAYYPSNQPAYAVQSHLATALKSTPHTLCHLAQNASHPFKAINIIFGRHINEM